MAIEESSTHYVLKRARDHNVRFIRLWFTDILGFLKSFAITINQLEEALEFGVGFDGAAIQGVARQDESDMVARPDPNTFQLLPWRPSGDAVARMFCDIEQPDGTPYEGDPRGVLRRALAHARSLGFTFYVGPEIEFFYFKSRHGKPEVLDDGGYFDLTPQDAGSDLRRDTILTLESMGIDVEFSHHEVAPSQHEIDLLYTDALTMADNLMTYRLIVKEVAQQHGVYATFMPQPLAGRNGSGLHLHQSLFKGSENAFFDSGEPHHLSLTAQNYVAGLLAHAGDITLVLNQWVNSYKRLQPGYEAPAYASWALTNHADLVRVPVCKAGREAAARVELRSPDPACNPYLAFAAMLTAGLDGVERGLPLPPPAVENVSHLSEPGRQALGVYRLPEDLGAAIAAAEASHLLRNTLGEHVFQKLIRNKRHEWDRFQRHVTDYELDAYLSLL